MVDGPGQGHPASECMVGPRSTWLCSSLSCLHVPREPLTWACFAQRPALRVWGGWTRRLRDPPPGGDKAAPLLWLATENTYHCPRCLRDANRTPLPRVQSLWRKAGSSQWAQTAVGTLPGPRAPKGRWREARAVTLLATWAREARGTEAVGALAGAPMQTGLTELAGVLLVLAEVPCGPWWR